MTSFRICRNTILTKKKIVIKIIDFSIKQTIKYDSYTQINQTCNNYSAHFKLYITLAHRFRIIKIV